MAEKLGDQELYDLVLRVFSPSENEKALALLVDVPDDQSPDHPLWRARREMVLAWREALAAQSGWKVSLVLYPNVHLDNSELPAQCWLYERGPLPSHVRDLPAGQGKPFEEVLSQHPMLMALTEMSATAPLKQGAKRLGFRATTTKGFKAEMIPALRVDYSEVNRRVWILKELMDKAIGAELTFAYPGGTCDLYLDLRHRTAHASGGMMPERGTAGNLPSGEAYIVPYEGEGEPSLSAGKLPIQFNKGEVVLYRIDKNKAVDVLSAGPTSAAEKARIQKEPAYANLAELGLGVLSDFGVKACGEDMLDEKLGLHIAFGRSDHFGGQVGPKDFTSPQAVIHFDYIFVPDVQPDVQVVKLDFLMEGGKRLPVMRDGKYVVTF